MAERWVLSPVDEITVEGKPRRVPRVSLVEDLGRPLKNALDENGDPIQIQPTVRHISSIYRANWCLSLVQADDFTAVDADVQIINLFEGNDLDIRKTPNELGIDSTRAQRIKQRATDKGVDTSGWTMDTPLWRMLLDIARKMNARIRDVRAFRMR